MVSCFRMELRRACTSKGMLVALVLGSVLAIHHFAMDLADPVSGMDGFAAEASRHAAMNFSPDFIWMHWLPADAYSFHGYLFFLLLPLIAGLPHAGSLFRDRADHYLQVIETRAQRSSYLAGKWAATFISGGVVAAVPGSLSFLLLLTRYPIISPVPGSGHHAVLPLSMFADLYMERPLIWVAIWLGILFVAGGLLATLGLAATFITGRGFIVHILPFLLLYVLTTLLTVFGHGGLSPLVLIDPSRNAGYPPWLLAIELAVIACIGVIPLLWGVKRGVR